MKKEIVHMGDAATTGAPLVQAVKLGNLCFLFLGLPRAMPSKATRSSKVASASRLRRP